jgi:hypothetical protein
MRYFCQTLILLFVLSLAPHSAIALSNARPTTTIHTRLTLDLCPEYPFGGVVVDVLYSVGASTALLPANITAQTINTANNTATFDLDFPSSYGTVPFNVVAFCRSARGFSDASNALSVSNCNALAVLDSDGDGLANSEEDTNCDNFFSPGDRSNPDNVDTDGDGVRDLVEVVSGTNPTNPGSSPRPFIYASGPYDPDGDGTSNPVVWRGSSGTWYIKDFSVSGNNLAVQFGLRGDIPLTYSPKGTPINLGVVRNTNNELHWLLRGMGFLRNNRLENDLPFGIFGDNLLPGPWEEPGVTNPAVARLFNGEWSFYFYLSDGTVRMQNWGGYGDIPKPADYDGDGLFDIAVFRPAEQKTYIIHSSDSSIAIYNFGSGTADHTVRGDYTGDGIDDISFWEPVSGLFTTMTSDNGFNDVLAQAKDPQHYYELQLGLYNIHLPLNWNMQNNLFLYTVVDHATGMRYFRELNDPNNPPQAVQWGLPGDHQG